MSPLWGVEHMLCLLFPPLNIHSSEWETPCLEAFGSGVLVLLTVTAPILQGKLMGEGWEVMQREFGRWVRVTTWETPRGPSRLH